jgi:hypothetical protein
MVIIMRKNWKKDKKYYYNEFDGGSNFIVLNIFFLLNKCDRRCTYIDL